MITPELANESAGVVVVYFAPGHEARHERVSHFEIARRLAALQGLTFAGEYDSQATYRGRVYMMPTETLMSADARRLGIDDAGDLFGGVVPQPFIATKAITHPLVSEDAYAPAGWSRDFAERIRDSILRGYSAFTLDDAREAGLRLLEYGPVRIKSVRATAGRGQSTVSDPQALSPALEALDSSEIATYGLVLEEHLDDVTTYSVGQVQVADLVATYYGTQRLTSDNDGESVYGGSDLVVVNGGFEALLDLDMPKDARHAVTQAQIYDSAALACFPGLFASRRNYDVAQGVDASGRQRSGVLEQSWRIGGASSAEILALEAFRSGSKPHVIRTSSLEIYGEDSSVPADATILFRGRDDEVGFITKCARIQSHDDT